MIISRKLFVIIFISFFCNPLLGQYQFKKLTTKDGLTLDDVDCISQDDEGLVYFGTNGLNVYDGNVIKTYDLSNTEGFGNKIKSILPVSSTKILIGCLDKGLFLLDKEIGRIQKFLLKFNEEAIILPILSVHDDEQGKIWIGTLNKGLFSINKKSILEYGKDSIVHCIKYLGSENFEINSICSSENILWIGTRFKGLFELQINNHEHTEFKKSELPLSSLGIWTLKVFDDSLFIGTHEGLNVYDIKTKALKVYLKEPNTPTLSNNIVRAVCKDRSGKYWVGTQEDGLYSLNFKSRTPEIIHFKNIPTNSNTINVNKILSLYAGDKNNLWIGTWNGGVNILSFHDQQFINIRNKGKENDLSVNMVWSIEQIEPDKYLIGTHGSGICSFESDNPFFSEAFRSKNINSISSLFLDKKNKILWIGTWGKGLKAFSFPDMKPILENILDTVLFQNDRIYPIVEDKHGIIWIGTVTHGVFSINLNESNQPVKYFDFFKQNSVNQGEESAEIRSIISDKNNTLWIGSLKHGLYKATTDERGNIIAINHIREINDKDEPNAPIRGMYLQDDGKLWIGQENGKIKIYNTLSDTCLTFSEASNNIAQRFREDKEGNMWIATYHGLIKYNPTTNSRQTFLSESCFYSLFFDSESNQIIAGCNKGIFTFNPSQLVQNPFYPEIVFSDLKIFNSPIVPGEKIRGKVPLEKSLNYTEQLSLPYSFDVFTIDITALSFNSQNSNQIYYQLENFDESWNKQTGSAISVTYTNLSPGDYILKVKTANKDNVWNPEIRKLKIKILPPWWRTDWAYAGYFLLIVLISILTYRAIRERVRIRYELKIEKIKKEQSEKLNELKLSFFTSISHDIRTPLTLILGPLEDIIQKEKKDTGLYRQLSMMKKNANMLLQLVNQVLDFRKIEKEKTVLKITRINLNDFIIQTIGQFEGKANQKNILMQFLSKKQNIELWADNSLLQKIIFNLLSNAIQYTDENGCIQITIEETEHFVRIIIADNGIGIDRKDLPKIFDRFYQTRNSKEGGSGIGLHLVKKMVELQKGVIDVESQLGKGSKFIIDFQKGNAHFNPVDIVSTTTENSVTETTDIDVLDNPASKKTKHKIIVIDDNDDIRNYIKNSLKTEYHISDFNNAGDGLLMAQKQDVSLIICDIMMPGMDGLEFCEHIKTDVNTSHIPVILLTAKTATENQIEGYEKGADDYICKPFSISLLKTRIANIIEQREKLQLKIKALNLEPSKISPTSVDEKFLGKTIKLIEENISNHEYSIDELSSSLGLSHDNFYRKIKNLTGMSTAKFMRMIRLKRAKQLLDNTDYNISEILYQVGFSNPSYFAKCFKQQFGVSPTEYKK